MRVIVTGGAGFIGSAVCRHLIRSTDWSVVNLDKLTYAANSRFARSIAGNPRYRFVAADIADRDAMRALFDAERPDAVINLAAESHVDRSIDSADDFIHTNINGTFVLLEEARRLLRLSEPGARAPPFASIMSRPTKFSASLARRASSPRRRHTIHPRLIRRARPHPIISCAPGDGPMDCR